jgi:hypothetical protein
MPMTISAARSGSTTLTRPSAIAARNASVENPPSPGVPALAKYGANFASAVRRIISVLPGSNSNSARLSTVNSFA